VGAKGRGVLVGGAVAIVFAADRVFLGFHYRYAGHESGLPPPGVLAWLAIPLVGLAVAVFLMVRRSTRDVGTGMLIGLVIGLPVATTLAGLVLAMLDV
jgi:hypothetical protein